MPAVRLAETQEPAATGRLDGLDAKLKTWYPKGLRGHRVVVLGEGPSSEVAIQRTGWCFCRATYILREAGREPEVVKPLIGGGRRIATTSARGRASSDSGRRPSRWG